MQVYMRYVDAKENVSVVEHSVWDRDRFVASQQAAYKKVGGSATEVHQDTYRRHSWQKYGNL